MKNLTEQSIEGCPLNVANPVEYAAEEYLCAMMVLDERNIPRFYQDKELSLVGRIDFAIGCFHNAKADGIDEGDSVKSLVNPPPPPPPPKEPECRIIYDGIKKPKNVKDESSG